MRRAKITIEIDVQLLEGYERDEDVKVRIQDAVAAWAHQEWRIHGRQPGQQDPNYPPPSRSGEVVPLLTSNSSSDQPGESWGTMTATWVVV